MTAEAIKSSPRWQGYTTTGKMLDADPKMLEPDKPLIVNCHNHVEQGLCADCAADFSRVLADVPELLDDLDIAIAGEAKFVEHGTVMGSVESSGTSRHPAIAAQQRLHLALLGDGTAAHPGISEWFDARDPSRLAQALHNHIHLVLSEPRLPQVARDVSSAAARAHHVIDAPKDLVTYECPDCGRTFRQERIHRDDDKTLVRCPYPSCGYQQPLDGYYKRVLAAAADRWMTITELVAAITMGGEVVTRKQIEGWIDYHGLARERRSRPRYVNGELVSDEVWTYRLGDVRERATAAAKRRKKLAD